MKRQTTSFEMVEGKKTLVIAKMPGDLSDRELIKLIRRFVFRRSDVHAFMFENGCWYPTSDMTSVDRFVASQLFITWHVQRYGSKFPEVIRGLNTFLAFARLWEAEIYRWNITQRDILDEVASQEENQFFEDMQRLSAAIN